MLSLAEIDRFFFELNKEFDQPLKVIITGAVAGYLMGHVRPSDDIDFEIQIPGKSGVRSRDRLEAAIKNVSQRLQLPAQYTESIAGWSQITLLNYREKAISYKKIGRVDIKFLAPEYWAIGKLTRYLPLDRSDLIGVFKNSPVKPDKLVSVLGEALRASPLSDRSREFKTHVIDFLSKEGPKVWGIGFDPELAVKTFKDKSGLI